MSSLALKILAEFRELPVAEREAVATAIAEEVRGADVGGRLRLLEELTTKYRCNEAPSGNLDDAWADGILPAKRTA